MIKWQGKEIQLVEDPQLIETESGNYYQAHCVDIHGNEYDAYWNDDVDMEEELYHPTMVRNY